MSGPSIFHRNVDHRPFGTGSFGDRAEVLARMFGAPWFLLGQTLVVLVWISLNVVAISLRWDPYPFILLNLAFSLQSAYAAPLILLAQSRQAARDKALSEADTQHREALAQASLERQDNAITLTLGLKELLDANTKLTEEVNRLTVEIHRRIIPPLA